jgi:hypothetical protein
VDEVFLSDHDENRLEDLFEKLDVLRCTAKEFAVGSKERAHAWREVMITMREIETIFPLDTGT